MCGIAGFVGGGRSLQARKSLIHSMLTSIAHRGPDAEGDWHSDRVGLSLGHVRLAIQDLSELGNQPMISNCGRYVMVFNGEIYNFKVLKRELESKGVVHRGDSDTEVLLSLIQEYGVEGAVSKCNGMFAIAVFDKLEQLLFLVRDRVGEKPLYYGWLNGGFAFASQVSALEKVYGLSLEIDQSSLTSFFRYGHVPAPYSIYGGIYKLKAGCCLVLDFKTEACLVGSDPLNDSRIIPFWSLADVVVSSQSSLITDQSEGKNLLAKQLDLSIERQLISDAPVGAFLSGGIDSTLVSAVASKMSRKRLSTFTIGFDDKRYDESKFAAAVANTLGTDHHEWVLSSSDILNTIPSLTDIYDEPFANASQIPAILVSKYAAESVKVCLSGDGGDELFAGYNRYVMPEKLNRKFGKMPIQFSRIIGFLLRSVPLNLMNYLYDKLIVRNNHMRVQSDIDLKILKLAEYFANPNSSDYYRYLLSMNPDPNLLVLNGVERDYLSEIEYPAGKGSAGIKAMQYRDQCFYLPDDCLAKMDRASMAYGLEVRSPLLDYELLELSWRFPTSMLANESGTKWPLRQYLYEMVPKELIDRPKMGFTVPVASWLKGELKDWAYSLISTDAGGVIDIEYATKLLNEHISGKQNNANKLWPILMFLSWYENRYKALA